MAAIRGKVGEKIRCGDKAKELVEVGPQRDIRSEGGGDIRFKREGAVECGVQIVDHSGGGGGGGGGHHNDVVVPDDGLMAAGFGGTLSPQGHGLGLVGDEHDVESVDGAGGRIIEVLQKGL